MRRNSFVLSLILTAAVLHAYPLDGMAQNPAQNAEARRLFAEGVEFQIEGSYVEAEKKFREAVTKYPKAEQSDRTAYYLIDTLVKLLRVQDARTEIERFLRTYPESRWRSDVNERILTLGGVPNAPQSAIWNSPEELRAAQARADLMLGLVTPAGPPNRIYPDEFPVNASFRAELLRQIVRMDTDRGIENAKEMLKADPSDPAVAANLGTIANSDSPHALPFLLGIWGNAGSSPNMRNTAFFWFSRRNPDKEEVAKAIMDLLAKRETERVASEALFRMTVSDHRAVLEKIVMSSNPDKFSLMQKIYRNGSVLLRTDLLMFVARLDDPGSVPFLVEAAESDNDASVRRAAAQALGSRKDVRVDVLEKLIKTAPRAPQAPQSIRLPRLPVPDSGQTPFAAP